MKRKQFAVIGIGRFGLSVACSLASQGYEVLAVDHDLESIQRISEVVTHAVCVDTTDEEALKALGIRNFDVVVVAIGEDVQASVLTTLLLKEAGVGHIVAKAQNELHGKMLEKIGADRVIYPERDMGMRIAHSLVSTNVLEYIKLSPDIGIVEVAVPQEMVDKPLSESNLREGYGLNLVAIKRCDSISVSPKPEEVFRQGDILFVIGENEGIHRLEQLD
ncbi:potassium channel family protein [Anaeroselena agilis]|uniref:TrkA family potassium uptake protein n=1 Tax=Anaeroselena agilis TaxID=3063788 RepID=A0ABU3NS91_9FIRM|nr:TrkA family potassium uptake protein [Selenomonadales bacterium 4137-cl]